MPVLNCTELFVFIVNIYILPDNLVTTPSNSVTFLCTALPQTITGVQWLVNDTLFEDIDNTDITAGFQTELGGIGTLNITNTPLAYNETRITCIAELASGQEEATVSLQIQVLAHGFNLLMYNSFIHRSSL